VLNGSIIPEGTCTSKKEHLALFCLSKFIQFWAHYTCPQY
jgi:hypothetical protein